MAHDAASSKGFPSKLTFHFLGALDLLTWTDFGEFFFFFLEVNFGGITLLKKSSGDKECNPVL